MADAPPVPPLSVPGDLPAGHAMEELFVIRHGVTTWNSVKKIQGSTEIPLAPEGLAQAERLAARFKGAHVDALWSSPQLRAAQTAEILGRALALEPVFHDAFRELNCGVFEGKSYPEVKRDHSEDYRRWMEEPEFPCPGGESFNGFTRRVRTGLDAIFASGHRRVMLSGHSGVSRAVAAALLGIDFRLAVRMEQRNTSVSIFRWEEGKLRLKLWNGTRHLDDVI